MSRRVTLLALVLFCPVIAEAKPNPWSFDFDASIADDPSYVTSRLQNLSNGLPGLPASGIVELVSGQVQLYFFEDVADALTRAKSSGPPILPPLVRTPSICVKHAAFEKPTLLAGSSSAACKNAETAAMAAFADKKLKTCIHVEFPETYVYEHSPLGWVDFNTVSTLESLISFAGEALTHVDYPTGLLPANFYEDMRKVIARLRYQSLKTELSDRVQAYQTGLTQLQSNSTCFDQTALTAFLATVNDLIAELIAAEQQLDSIYNAGVAQAAVDLKAVQAQGRNRAPLPFPGLTDRDRELLAFYIGGIYWRMRGAGLIAVPPDPDQGLLRRMLYTQYPYKLIAEMAAGTADAQGVGFDIFVQENWGYAEWYDMGNWPGRDKYADLVDMTIRGKVATSLVAPKLEQRGFDVKPLIAGGLQMGPCYYYIWEELPDFTLGPDLQYPYMQFLELPTATGEFCTGAALALGLVRSLLGGKPCTPDCTGKPCGADNGCGGTCGACPADAGIPGHEAGAVSSDGPPVTDAAHKQDGSSPPGFTGSTSGCSCHLSADAEGRMSGAGLALLVLLVLGAWVRSRRR
jgi:hypothetical protein